MNKNKTVIRMDAPKHSAPKVKATILNNGNTKLGKSIGTFSKLMGNKDYYVPEYDVVVAGTCGHFCEGCEANCYVKKSYVRHTNRKTGECSVIKGHAKNTIAFYTDIDKAFIDLDGQLNRKRKKFIFVRIDQSGELISSREFIGWAWLAERHPETVFYVYTKAFEYVIKVLLNGEVPLNLVVLFSVWHEYGITEYSIVQHLPNVKAFVYCDKNHRVDGWGAKEYGEYGLAIQTFCPAYDAKGRMNHDLPCEKCRKCMILNKKLKIIGCWDH